MTASESHGFYSQIFSTAPVLIILNLRVLERVYCAMRLIKVMSRCDSISFY
jgi:hypothetical protein